MRKLILMIIILLMCSLVKADQFNINMNSWSQERKNMTHAMLVKGLFADGITHDKITVNRKNGNVDIPNPSSNPSAVVLDIMNIYDAWKIDMDARIIIAQAEEAELETERNTNAIKGLKLNQIDTWLDNQIDQIQNLSDAKQFLRVFTKRVVRYLKAHER